MPKIVDKAKMKDMILEAALESFYEFGFNQTSMNKIADKAKIAKGTLYIYFNSKDELMSEISNRHFFKIKNKMFKEEYYKTLNEFLESIRNLVSIDKEERKLISLFFEAFGENFTKKDFMNKYAIFFTNMSKDLENYLNFLKEQKSIKTNINTTSYARVLVSMIDGVLLHRSFFDIEDSFYKKMIDEMLLMIESYLK